MTKRLRVFVDANVLLSAALYRGGFPSLLRFAKSEFTFVVSEYVLTECEQNITRRAPTPRSAAAVRQLFRAFVEHFGFVIVPPSVERTETGIQDPADVPVYIAAADSRCDVICTYNLQHFPIDGIRALPPLALLNLLDDRSVLPAHVEVQRPVLGDSGTLLVLAHFHHPSSLGRIIKTGQGARIFADENGFVQVEGHSSGRFTARAPLEAQSWVAFILRYKPSGQFQAVMWSSRLPPGEPVTSADLTKLILTDGQIPFAPPITTQLVFEEDHHFAAAVRNISGVPLYVRDSQIPFVISSGSLECLVGSRNLDEVFSRVDFRGVGGDVYVGLRP